MRACVFDPPKSEYPVEPRQSTLPNSYFTACARSSGVFRPRSDILSYPIRFSCGLMARHPPLSPPRPPRPRRPSGPWLAARHPRVYQRFYDVCRPAPGTLLLFITVAPWRGALIRAGLMKVARMDFEEFAAEYHVPRCLDGRTPSPILLRGFVWPRWPAGDSISSRFGA